MMRTARITKYAECMLIIICENADFFVRFVRFLKKGEIMKVVNRGKWVKSGQGGETTLDSNCDYKCTLPMQK